MLQKAINTLRRPIGQLMLEAEAEARRLERAQALLAQAKNNLECGLPGAALLCINEILNQGAPNV